MTGLALVAERVLPERFLPGRRMLPGRELRLADGDSFTLAGTRIRLADIDAVELHQFCGQDGASWPCGRRAREALAAIIGDAAVACRALDEDRYGRTVARCRAVGQDGQEWDIGGRMVSEGFAVAVGLHYAPEELPARVARRGIWAGPFEQPADWRAAHPRPVEAD
nr:thermonuclease family protein [Ancylobacter crimeensis]